MDPIWPDNQGMNSLSPPLGHRTRIKMCGLTRAQDVASACELGVDALGFVLYPPSPRAVSLEVLRSLTQSLPPFVTPVLLFVNASHREIEQALSICPRATLQFHGDETPEWLEALGVPYIKVLRMKERVSLEALKIAHPKAMAFLLDAYVDAYGGAGHRFDWNLVNTETLDGSPLILSGGLSPDNVGLGIQQIRPWAVDVSSGIEVSKGVKSPDLMAAFVQAVRLADLK